MEALGVVIGLTVLYVLPIIIAVERKHRNAGAIAALTVLLGWTTLGWIAALVWSLTNSEPDLVLSDRVR